MPPVMPDRNAAVVLDHEQADGLGQVGRETAGVVDGAAGNDETHGTERYGASRYVAEPSPEVQQDTGVIQGHFPNPGVRNGADPFILAEARGRGFHVVTYAGQSFSGVPTSRWHRTMPGICQHFSVPCCTLPEALEHLGLKV
jgi:hypothetical protein